MSPARPALAEYEELLGFRTTLRRFLHWSEQQAAAAGLTPAQHQLLLAIKGHAGPEAPRVRDVAEYLVSKHHSVVELVDRAVEAGLVERRRDGADARVVRLTLTRRGEERLAELTRVHLEELRRLREDWPLIGETASGDQDSSR